MKMLGKMLVCVKYFVNLIEKGRKEDSFMVKLYVKHDILYILKVIA